MHPKLLAHAKEVARLTTWRIRLTIPSILARGEEFSLRVSITGADQLPCEGFHGTLVFEDCIGVEGLPKTLSCRMKDGVCEVPGLKATGAELALVRARVEGTGKVGGDPIVWSNPAWVFDEPPYRLYWGDLHVHTRYSNCWPWSCLDPEFCYAYARDVTHLDFAAAADHLRGIAADEKRWPRLQALAKHYYEPGRFVPFLAFESSHAKGYGGDNNAYYASDNAPYFWLERDDMRGVAPTVPLEDLWAFLDSTGHPYFTVPHHTGRKAKNRTFDEDRYDGRREPLFEIFSTWGSSEMRHTEFPIQGGNAEDEAYFVDALKAGCRFGVIASSDSHATLPGSESKHYTTPFGQHSLHGWKHKGLAAVRAPGLTRGGVWRGMTSRATYGTTLSRSLVDVRIGELTLGQEAEIDPSNSLRRERRIDIAFTLEFGRSGGALVVLMRNGEELMREELRGHDMCAQIQRVTFTDSELLEDVAIRDAKFHPGPFVSYYVRIENGDQHTQWTSPIWLDV